MISGEAMYHFSFSIYINYNNGVKKELVIPKGQICNVKFQLMQSPFNL